MFNRWFSELQRLNITLEWLHNQGTMMTQATENLTSANTRLAASVVRATDALKTANTRIADLTAQLAAAPVPVDTDPQVQAEADAVNAQADALDAALAPPATPAA